MFELVVPVVTRVSFSLFNASISSFSSLFAVLGSSICFHSGAVPLLTTLIIRLMRENFSNSPINICRYTRLIQVDILDRDYFLKIEQGIVSMSIFTLRVTSPAPLSPTFIPTIFTVGHDCTREWVSICICVPMIQSFWSLSLFALSLLLELFLFVAFVGDQAYLSFL